MIVLLDNQTKLMHFYLIRSDLTGLPHVHPSMSTDGTWTASLAPAQPHVIEIKRPWDTAILPPGDRGTGPVGRSGSGPELVSCMVANTASGDALP